MSFDADSPFDQAFSALPLTTSMSIRGSLVDVADTVDMAKRILLQHRVKSFTGADVVALTGLILERESELHRREVAQA